MPNPLPPRASPARRGRPCSAVIVAALLWPCVAAASGATIMHYTARLHGVALLDVSLCLQFDAASYSASVAARTVGLAEMLAHGRAEGRVEGAIDGNAVKPRAYVEHGRISGDTHAVAIDFPDGNPVLRMQVPSQPKYRVPVPASDLPGAIDGLSAVALEALAATRTGGCDGVALVYDGLQLRRATTHKAGTETLQPSSRSIFSGPALRCDTQSVMLAGFLKADPEGPQRRPRFSHVWLAATAPGGPAVPVRVTFDADILGDIIVDLDAVRTVQTPACGAAETPGDFRLGALREDKQAVLFW